MYILLNFIGFTYPLYFLLKLASLPLYIIIVSLVGFVWGLDIVTLPDHGDVTLDITFTPSGDVIRVRQDGPLMIKLVLWERRQSVRPNAVSSYGCRT